MNLFKQLNWIYHFFGFSKCLLMSVGHMLIEYMQYEYATYNFQVRADCLTCSALPTLAKFKMYLNTNY